MALAVASSTVSAATASATATQVAYPASITSNDVLVLVVATKPYTATINTPSGWTLLTTRTNGTTAAGTDTGSMKVALFVKKADGTETGNLTISITSGNSSWAVMYRVTKASGQDVAFASTTGVDNTANTTWLVNFDDQVSVEPGDLIIVGGGWPTDAATTVSASSISLTGATFTGVVAAGDRNPRITTGLDSGGNTNHASVNTGTVTQFPSWQATLTAGTNRVGAAVLARLREFPPVEIDGAVTATFTITGDADVVPGSGGSTGSQFLLRTSTARLRAGAYIRGVAGSGIELKTGSDSGRVTETSTLVVAVAKTASDSARGSESRSPVAKATTRADAGASTDSSDIVRVGGTLFKTLHKAIGHAPAARADYVTAFSPNTAAEGWHRGDGALSTPGTGWRLFSFNDFFVSDGGGGDSVYAIFRRNSVLMVDLDDGDVWWLSSGDGYPIAGSVTFPSPNETDWAWLDGGWQVATNDVILLAGIWETGTPYAQNEFRVMKVSGLDTAAPVYSSTYTCGLALGTADWRGMPFTDAGWVYLYGIGGDWGMHLARHTIDTDPANYATGWEYRTAAGGWSTNAANSAGVTVASAPLRALDVIPWQGKYLAAAKDFDSGPEGAAGATEYTELKVWVADQVTGPWAYIGVVYDTEVTNWWSYAARLEQLPGTSDLSAVWSVNTTEALGFTPDTYGPQIALPVQVGLPTGTDTARVVEGPGDKTTSVFTDTARFAEASALVQTRSLVGTDAGRGADASSLLTAVAKSGADAGRGAEAAAPLDQGRTSTDAGRLGEARALTETRALNVSDSAPAAETSQRYEERQVAASDAAPASSSRSPVDAATARLDAGGGVEVAAAVTDRVMVGSDAGGFGEDSQLAEGNNLALSSSDGGRLADAGAVVVTALFVTSTDTGAGREGPDGFIFGEVPDTGAFTEATTAAAAMARADQAPAVEVGVVDAVGWLRSDTARFGEVAEVEQTTLGSLDRSDTARMVEAVVLDRDFSSVDQGAGTDQHDPVALATETTDTGASSEASGPGIFEVVEVIEVAETSRIDSLGSSAFTSTEPARFAETASIEATLVRSDAGHGAEPAQGREEGYTGADDGSIVETAWSATGGHQAVQAVPVAELALVEVVLGSRDSGSSGERREGAGDYRVGADDGARFTSGALVAAALAAIEAAHLLDLASVDGSGQPTGLDTARIVELAIVETVVGPGRVRNTTTPRRAGAVNTSTPRKGLTDTTRPRRSPGVARQ